MIKINNTLKKITQNKIFQIFLIIVIASICASPPFALKQIYIGEDALYHMLRIEEFHANILNGKIFPHMYARAIGEYGYASAFFYPELTLLIPVLFCMLGFSTISALNISIFIYNLIAGIVAYYCINIYLKDNLKDEDNITWLSLISTISYIMYPYRLYNIFYRSALNEFIAICFIPIAFLSMYKIFIKKEFKYWKMLSISFTLSLLTHLVTTLMLGIILLILMILNINLLLNKDFLKSMLKAICCSVLASAYFLFPMIEQMLSNEFFYTSLPKINNPLIYGNKTIDKKAFTLVGNFLSQPILIFINILIILLFCMIFKKTLYKSNNKKKPIIIFSVLTMFYVFIMLTDIFPWITVIKIFPIILKIQFPFRFLALMGIFYSFILALTVPVLKNKDKIKKVIIIIVILLTPKVIVDDSDIEELSIKEQDLIYVDNSWSLGYGEYIPSKMPPEYEKYIKNRGNTIVVKDINNNIEQIKRDFKESHTQYTIDNLNNQIKSLELPLIYYKGYAIKENENNIQIKESDNGLIQLENIPNKKIDIEIYYKGTVIQKISNIITTVFLFGIAYEKGVKKFILKRKLRKDKTDE